MLELVSLWIVQKMVAPTDDEHGAGRRLKSDSAHSEEGPAPIDRILYHVNPSHSRAQLLLLLDCCPDLTSLSLAVVAVWTQPLQRLLAIFIPVLQNEPARGFWDKQHADHDEEGDDVDKAERDQVG